MLSYKTLPLLFSLLIIPACYHSAPAAPHYQQRLQPNYNPDPNPNVMMDSRDVPYRPNLEHKDPAWALYDTRKEGQSIAALKENQQAVSAHKDDPEEVSNARADDIGDDTNQNQIMNEISNIIQQNNQKMRHIARNNIVETPVLTDNTQDKAAPIVNEKDPNNPEQFERLPRVNERIPIVDREIIKVPNIRQRIPVAVANEQGMIYNVHKHIPFNNQQPRRDDAVDIKQHIDNEINHIQLNQLEDEKNVDDVIDNLDHNMNRNAAKPGVHAPRIFGESLGEFYRPDLCPEDSRWVMYDTKQDNIHANHGEHKVQADRVKAQSGAERVRGVNEEKKSDQIHHHHQDHHLHRGADMVVKAAKTS
ncbi:hypothetical protein WDU94_000130 [Cyamophila willieti]